jgi:hypothetical protein
MKYDTSKLANMGYGDVTRNGDTIEMTESEVAVLAESVGGTVDEIETARV